MTIKSSFPPTDVINQGYPEKLKTINGPDGKPVFEVYMYPDIKTVCIQSPGVDVIYELKWDEWIRVSDLLLDRFQKEQEKPPRK